MGQFLEVAAEKTRGLNWTSTNIARHSGVDKVDWSYLPTQYADNSFDGIYNEHFIEHLYKYQGINFLKEAFRILKPGGTIRTVWPPYEFIEWLVRDEDLSQHPFVEHYYRFYILKHKFAPEGNRKRRKQEQVALGLLHQNGQHLYVWPKAELFQVLQDLGFDDVRECEYQKSKVKEFNGIDTPGQIRAMHSAVIEATKPW